MKVPKKGIHRRMLPKVVPLRDQNRIVTGNVGSCSVAKNTLKPLIDHGRNDVCKSKAKTKPQTQVSKINPLLSHLKYTTNGMEAFIILFQRLTADMDVFTLPCIKRELSKYKSEWLEMKLKLEEANISCQRLNEEIEMQKLLHIHKLEDLRECHSEQLNRLKAYHTLELEEHSVNYKKQTKELEKKLKNQEQYLQQRFRNDLKSIQNQAEQKLESILEEAKRQVENLKTENEAWKEKLRNESCKTLEAMEQKVRQQIEQLESKHETRMNVASEELRKKEEQFVAFSNKRAENLLKRKLSKIANEEKQNVETIPHGFKVEFQNLEEEVCSLRTVLDLKHSEIQDLRKQNEKLLRETQDFPFILQKLDSAQARVEDLNAQLHSKIEIEKKLLKENRKLLETVHAESEKKKRLAFLNEELSWKLRKSTQVAKTLAIFNSNHLSKEGHVSEPEASCHSTPIHTKHGDKQLNFELRNSEKLLKRSRTDNDIKIESPSEGDVASKVLGVVEKNDSVSWVLELDESPIAMASRMLRRANSLRGVPSQKKADHDRPLLTLPTRNKQLNLSASAEDATLPSKVDFGVQCWDVNSSTDKTDLNDHLSTTIHDSLNDAQIADDQILEKENQHGDEDDIIVDISAIFDFLQDSDVEAENPSTSETNRESNSRSSSPYSWTNDDNFKATRFSQEVSDKRYMLERELRGVWYSSDSYSD